MFDPNEIGKVYGMLTIISYVGVRHRYDHVVGVRCECGVIKEVLLNALRQNQTVSCGCYNRKIASDRKKTHGLSGGKHPLYRVWLTIKTRCYNNKFEQYIDYGGRGIRMCDGWLNSFESFYDWCICNGWEKGLDIDRKENDGNYDPYNCRFVTRSVNCRNKRNNRLVEYNGETKTLTEWCIEFGQPYDVVRGRLNRGWSSDDALLTQFR